MERTLYEVAQAVGLGRSALSKIEDGTTAEPDASVLDRLADYFGAAGVIFHENGRVELRPGLQRIGGQKVN
jgi:transcriptional regulator with XRE-family HTH domain